MGFVAGAGLVLSAIDFIAKHAESGSDRGVEVKSDKVTYPQGLPHSDAPHELIPFMTIVLTPNGDHNLVEVPLLAAANYGGLGQFQPEYVGDEEKETGLEVANCQIQLGKTAFHRMMTIELDHFPLEVIASADPTPAKDKEGNPAVQFTVEVRGATDNPSWYGKLDVTLWVLVGPRGNVELVNELDRSDPAVTIDERGEVFVFIRGPLSWLGLE